MAVVKYKNPKFVEGGTEPKYIPVGASGGGIEEAPLDDSQYARQNGEWVETASVKYVDEKIGHINELLDIINGEEV